MKRLALTLASVCLFALPAIAAASAPVVNETDVVKDFTEATADVNPCTGDRGTLTTTFNGVFHITEFADGTVHVTSTATGTFTFDAKGSAEDFTGRFTVWFGFNGNTRNATGSFTTSVTATGSEGSSLQFTVTAQFKVNAAGDVVVEFEKLRCR